MRNGSGRSPLPRTDVLPLVSPVAALPNDLLDAVGQSIIAFDLAGMILYWSGFLAELLEQFVEQTDLSLAALRGALQTGDTSAVSHIAQNIRGGGAQLGGRRLALSCSRLERRVAAGAVGRDRSEVREIEFDYQELCRTLTLELALAPAEANDELAILDGVTP